MKYYKRNAREKNWCNLYWLTDWQTDRQTLGFPWLQMTNYIDNLTTCRRRNQHHFLELFTKLSSFLLNSIIFVILQIDIISQNWKCLSCWIRIKYNFFKQPTKFILSLYSFQVLKTLLSILANFNNVRPVILLLLLLLFTSWEFFTSVLDGLHSSSSFQVLQSL